MKNLINELTEILEKEKKYIEDTNIKCNKYPLKINKKRGYNLIDIRDYNKIKNIYKYNFLKNSKLKVINFKCKNQNTKI